MEEAVVKEGDGSIFASIKQERDSLKVRVLDLEAKIGTMEPANNLFQQYIEGPPVSPARLWGQACANDTITTTSWADEWTSNMGVNHKHDWDKDNILTIAGQYAFKPVIVAGSGPSLKKNAKHLKDIKGMGLISCLHNFAYFEDMGIKPDYYVNLDAGKITIEEVSQGGKEKPEYYWERTANHTLLTAIHTHPDLNDGWKGKRLWYKVPMPDNKLNIEQEKLCKGTFKSVVQVGGHSVGACLYIARAIMGGCPIVFVGVDYAFDRNKRFHPFDSPYDQQFSGLIPVTDVYGDRRYTWQSYYNFKCYMDYMACGGQGNNPGFYINCTEGGILGAYPEGNIRQITQMTLEDFIARYTLHENLTKCIESGMLLF